MGRPLVHGLGWLAFPAGLVVLGVLWGHRGDRPEGAPRRGLSEEAFPRDAKLERTLSRDWRDPTGRLRPLGVDGLSIDMLIAEREWAAMRREELVNLFRVEEREALLRFDGGPTVHATYRVRGGQSLGDAFRNRTPERLNFNIRLPRRLPFAPDVELNRFYLQNQVDDRFMFEMRAAYLLLEEIGLFHCYNQFVTLTVDGMKIGAYLLVERPESAIRRVFPQVRVIARRSRPGGPPFQEIYRRSGTRSDHPERLERALAELQGGKRLAEVERLLDLDGYLRWLAFNSFVRNADSFDEVFFFVVPSATHPAGRLRIMAWDYDDLRASRPSHPRRAIRDPLLFGAEDELDLLVQAEPRLYARFQRIYRRLLEESLTEERLTGVLARVAGELAPVDLGLPPRRSQRFRSRRRREMHEFEQWLLARRSQLLDALPGEGPLPPSDPETGSS